MKRWLAVTLGILTAIGGFVDLGDLVANSETGAGFGMWLAPVVVVWVVGICVYAEMCGRIAAVSGRPVFFFSSGGVEEGWTALVTSRANVFVGFPPGRPAVRAIMGVEGHPPGIRR